MTLQVKKSGAYAAPISVSVKKNGVYTAVVGIFAKVGGAYQSVMGAVTAQPLRVVSTNNRVFAQTYTTSSTDANFQFRVPKVLGGPVTEIVLAFTNWCLTAVTGWELQNPVDLPFTKLALELDGVGFVPVTFSGARSKAIPGNVAMVLSDPIQVSAFGQGDSLPRDTKFWIRGLGTYPSSTAMYAGSQSITTGAKMSLYNSVSTADQVDAIGALVTTNFNARSDRAWAPAPIMLGRFTSTGILSVAAIGDSHADGSSDAYNPPAVLDGAGYISRATVDGGGLNAIAMLHLTKYGDLAHGWIANGAFRAAFLPYCNVAFDEFGRNDLTALSGVIGANAVYANLQTMWAQYRAAGIQKIVRARLIRKTTGTWATLGGQTVPGGETVQCDQVDTNMAAALSATQIDSYVDVWAPIADGTDPHCWASPGYTSDGLHALPAAHIVQSPIVRAALLATTVTN